MNDDKGTIIGTVSGANMLILCTISSFLQQAARGLVIIVAVLPQYNSYK
jgi:ribose/xylose/arabinose/galactoside ABC-type transport system permease subunit